MDQHEHIHRLQIYRTRQDKTKLKENLTKIAASIEKWNHQTFIFSRDIQKWGKVFMKQREIIPAAFEQIKKSDLLFVLIEQYSKSTGMGLEIGYAKALGVPVIIAAPENEDCDYLMGLYDKFVTFDTFEDLIDKLRTEDVFTEFKI